MISKIQINGFIHKTFRSLGLNIHRITPTSNSYLQLLQALNLFNIDVVFDIGANTGQFASELRSFGYKGQIVSFEPLSGPYQTLIDTSTRDPDWKIHQRCAIGNLDGEIEINIASNSYSSSILPMLDVHSSAAPTSSYIGTESVPISRLDSVTSTYLSPANRLFIKIDTQGFEWEVIDGAAEALKQAQGVQIELSLVPLYEGQHLWLEILRRLESEGFTLWAIDQEFIDHRDGRTLQINATFFRV
jgi:FkbM family methyltransferase